MFVSCEHRALLHSQKHMVCVQIADAVLKLGCGRVGCDLLYPSLEALCGVG